MNLIKGEICCTVWQWQRKQLAFTLSVMGEPKMNITKHTQVGCDSEPNRTTKTTTIPPMVQLWKTGVLCPKGKGHI